MNYSSALDDTLSSEPLDEVREEEVEDEKEEETNVAAEESVIDDLFIGFVNITEDDEFDNDTDDTATNNNATLFGDDDHGWKSSNLTADDTEEDILYDSEQLFPTLLLDDTNTTAVENDTELYADFLVDTSDNDTAASELNETEEASGEELFGAEKEDDRTAGGDEAGHHPGGSGTSDLETNVDWPLGGVCVFLFLCVCLLFILLNTGEGQTERTHRPNLSNLTLFKNSIYKKCHKIFRNTFSSLLWMFLLSEFHRKNCAS